MRKDKENNKIGLGVGYVSAMLIFAVLCLTIFAAMSYNAAASTDSFNNRSGTFLKQYYQADSKAKEILAELHGIAVSAAKEGLFEDIFEEEAAEIDGVTVSRSPEGYRASYTVEINDRQELAVTILFDKYGNYTEERWQSRNTGSEESEGHLGVWNGSDMFD